MKKIMHVIIGIAAGAFLIAGMVGIVMAAVVSPKVADVGSSDIPKTVYRQEKLTSEAQVLKTSTTNVQNALKNKTLKQLISSEKLTDKQFRKEVNKDFIADLQLRGYSKDQITIANQHNQIEHLKKELKKNKK